MVTSSGSGKPLSSQVTNSALPSGEPYSREIIWPDCSRETAISRLAHGSGK
jgi:hypothetical protein